jgi:DNA polymerase III epsilon subunit family exonuclease
MPDCGLLDTPLVGLPVAVVDLEMTGLSVSRDRICEIAVVRWDGETLTEWATLVSPGVSMSKSALRCHGLTDAAVADAPAFRDVLDRLTPLLDGCVFVAHNAPFDLGFLERAYAKSGQQMPRIAVVDTLMMARRLFAFPKNDLRTACERLGVAVEQLHRAMADARATWELFSRMLNVLDPQGSITVSELDALLEALAPDSPLRLAQRQTLRRAFERRETVWIDYQSTSHPTEGLVHREVALWRLKLPRLQGWCHLRDGVRVFRLDRCRVVSTGERAYQIPEDFEPGI